MNINKNSKILIIPDVHTHFQDAENICKLEKDVDLIVFLGDEFDEFDDTPETTTNTAKWLKWSINQENRIHLAANHGTIQYGYNNCLTRCSGYKQWKQIIIDKHINDKDWDKFKYFVVLETPESGENPWLLTHGGLHASWLPSKIITNKDIFEFLKRQVVVAKKELKAGRSHWIAESGFMRGGDKPFGGILWLDFDYEFTPVKGLNQLLGHTPSSKYRIKDTENSKNICLDTHPKLLYYAIYQNGKIEIKKR